MGYFSKKQLAAALQAGFNLRFASAIVSGVKFDIFLGEDKMCFGIWLIEAEAETLAKNLNAPSYDYLTVHWGMDLFHLPHEILVKEVIPRMAERYLWWKYEVKRPQVAAEAYFNLGSWRVGLG